MKKFDVLGIGQSCIDILGFIPHFPSVEQREVGDEAKKLIDQGRIPRDESIVLAITGNGLKTQESLVGKVADQHVIDANLEAFEDLYPTLTKGDNEKYAIG